MRRRTVTGQDDWVELWQFLLRCAKKFFSVDVLTKSSVERPIPVACPARTAPQLPCPASSKNTAAWAPSSLPSSLGLTWKPFFSIALQCTIGLMSPSFRVKVQSEAPKKTGRMTVGTSPARHKLLNSVNWKTSLWPVSYGYMSSHWS